MTIKQIGTIEHKDYTTCPTMGGIELYCASYVPYVSMC